MSSTKFAWARAHAGRYGDRDRVYADLEGAMKAFNHLTPGLTPVPPGDPQAGFEMIRLEGTLPVFWKTATYNVPVTVYLPPQYPRVPPRIRVTPTNDMQIRQGTAVADTGEVVLPFLSAWAQRREPPPPAGPLPQRPPPAPAPMPPQGTPLAEALRLAKAAFEMQIPVYQRKANQPAPQQQSQPARPAPSPQPPAYRPGPDAHTHANAHPSFPRPDLYPPPPDPRNRAPTPLGGGGGNQYGSYPPPGSAQSQTQQGMYPVVPRYNPAASAGAGAGAGAVGPASPTIAGGHRVVADPLVQRGQGQGQGSPPPGDVYAGGGGNGRAWMPGVVGPGAGPGTAGGGFAAAYGRGYEPPQQTGKPSPPPALPPRPGGPGRPIGGTGTPTGSPSPVPAHTGPGTRNGTHAGALPPNATPNSNANEWPDESAVRLASLRDAVADKVRRANRELREELDRATRAGTLLQQGRPRWEAGLREMAEKERAAQSNTQQTRHALPALSHLLASLAALPVDPDDVVLVGAPLHAQALEVVAADCALEDAMGEAARGLGREKVEGGVGVVIKKIRELAKEQFEVRVLKKRCQEEIMAAMAAGRR